MMIPHRPDTKVSTPVRFLLARSMGAVLFLCCHVSHWCCFLYLPCYCKTIHSYMEQYNLIHYNITHFQHSGCNFSKLLWRYLLKTYVVLLFASGPVLLLCCLFSLVALA